ILGREQIFLLSWHMGLQIDARGATSIDRGNGYHRYHSEECERCRRYAKNALSDAPPHTNVTDPLAYEARLGVGKLSDRCNRLAGHLGTLPSLLLGVWRLYAPAPMRTRPARSHSAILVTNLPASNSVGDRP